MEKRLGNFVIADSEKCSGCKSCEVACFAAHNKGNGVGHTVGTVETPIIPRLYLTRLDEGCMPVQCRQCEDSPCLNSCEERAISKVDGVMMVSEKSCIGCKNCIMACPFGAIELLPMYSGKAAVKQVVSKDDKIIAYKCDLCKDIGEPSCVKACPHEALRLVDPTQELKDKKIRAAIALAGTSL